MTDPDWVRELRRVLNAELPEYVRDLAQAVPTSVVKDIVSDFRSYNPHPAQDPSARVSVQGAGVVKTGDVGPQHRPVDTDATTDRSGWREAPKVDAWRAPGIEHVDRLLDQADAIDKAERIRQLAEAAAVQRALKPAEPKVQEPKARGDKKA
jgi:hypothetical protein